MKISLDPVTLATPFFILSVILEIVLARFGLAKARYEPRDTATSLFMGLGRNVAGVATAGLVAATTVWVYRHRLFTVPMNAAWAWVAIFFLEDLTYYWFHRLSHERRVWWAAHVNHHSSQHYNLSTALRQTWTGGVSGAWALWLPLALLGFPPAMIAIEQSISLIYQFWIHTEAIGRLPAPVEAVFNTPSHHRVHHARNPRYLDRNYAGILIIWDRLFGTFERVAFHEWIAIGQDLMTARSPAEAFAYVFGPPGWSPDGSRETSAELKRKWRAREAESPAPNPSAAAAPDPARDRPAPVRA